MYKNCLAINFSLSIFQIYIHSEDREKKGGGERRKKNNNNTEIKTATISKTFFYIFYTNILYPKNHSKKPYNVYNNNNVYNV